MRDSFLISSRGSDRGTAYGMSSKIIRHSDHLFIGWLDAPEAPGRPTRAMLGVCDPETGSLQQSMLLGEAHDNHCGPAMALDANGRLHVIIGAHGQAHRFGRGGGTFRYRWSDAPHESASWSEPEPLGPADTYPSLVVDGEGTLHLAHRECGLTEEQRWELWYRRKPAGKPWESPRRLLASPTRGYCNWHQCLALSPSGTLHMVLTYHHGPTGRNVDCVTVAIAHLCSKDGGDTWYNEGAVLPAERPAEMAEISLMRDHPQGEFGISNLLVDADDHPWFLATDPDAPTGILWRQEGTGWKANSLPPVALSPGIEGGFTWGGITYDGQGRVHLVMPARPDGVKAHFFDPGLELYHAILDERARIVSFRQLTASDPDVANWLPSLEWWDWQRENANCADGPWLLYTQGLNLGGIGGDNTNALSTRVHLTKIGERP